jgi:hypothetical protein
VVPLQPLAPVHLIFRSKGFGDLHRIILLMFLI